MKLIYKFIEMYHPFIHQALTHFHELVYIILYLPMLQFYTNLDLNQIPYSPWEKLDIFIRTDHNISKLFSHPKKDFPGFFFHFCSSSVFNWGRRPFGNKSSLGLSGLICNFTYAKYRDETRFRTIIQ